MRNSLALSLLSAALAASPAFARDQDRPITDRKVDAVDVAATPVTDLNLRKDEIPEQLIDAQLRPYDLSGLRKCSQIIGAVDELNALLGPDLDLPQDAEGRVSAGRVAKSVVGSFIPFRGIIREVSGANDQERKITAAIQAGLARRGFLKGVGATKGCAYPARPARDRDVQAYLSATEAQAEAEKDSKQDKKDKKTRKTKGGYVSEPVVQQVD